MSFIKIYKGHCVFYKYIAEKTFKYIAVLVIWALINFLDNTFCLLI